MQEIQETWVRSLSQEDPLEKEGHGNPLEYFCLENLVDRKAWLAPDHRVTRSDMTATEHHAKTERAHQELQHRALPEHVLCRERQSAGNLDFLAPWCLPGLLQLSADPRALSGKRGVCDAHDLG